MAMTYICTVAYMCAFRGCCLRFDHETLRDQVLAEDSRPIAWSKRCPAIVIAPKFRRVHRPFRNVLLPKYLSLSDAVVLKFLAPDLTVFSIGGRYIGKKNDLRNLWWAP